MPKMEKAAKSETKADASRRNSRLATPTDLDPADVEKVAKALNGCLADSFVLYMKIKNFHWHMSGPNFRDYHEMLDDHAEAVFGTIDELAERVRKIGARTLTSLSDALEQSQLVEQTRSDLAPDEMIRELLEDNKAVVAGMRKAHKVCDDAEDIASASLLENFVDATEKRCWFLFEIAQSATATGH